MGVGEQGKRCKWGTAEGAEEAMEEDGAGAGPEQVGVGRGEWIVRRVGVPRGWGVEVGGREGVHVWVHV